MAKKGRPRKYKTEEERRLAARDQQRARRARRKGGARSWIKTLGDKLADAAEPADETPPERKGEPFADLPPLDLPSSGSPAPDAGSQSAENGSTDGNSTEPADTKTEPSNDNKKPGMFDTVELQKMGYGLGKMYMLMTSKYASERGYTALGEDFAEIVGNACAVIVKKNAERLQIDDEEGAAYVVGIFGGFNGVQAFRAYREERSQKVAQQKRGQEAHEQPRGTEPAHTNGVAAPAASSPVVQRQPAEAAAGGPYK